MVYSYALRRLKEFKPEFVLISAGFDSHIKDPLAQFKLETDHTNHPNQYRYKYNYYGPPQ